MAFKIKHNPSTIRTLQLLPQLNSFNENQYLVVLQVKAAAVYAKAQLSVSRCH